MVLTATVSNATNTAVTWTVADIPGGNSTVGTISAAGAFTAPQALPVPATVSVTATSVADPSQSAATTITITSDIGIAITPPVGAVELGSQQTFQAAVSSAGKPSTVVNWTLSGTGCTASGCGSVNSSGEFTAPQMLPSPPTVLLTATSAADPSKAAAIPVSVTSRFTFSITGPSSVTANAAANFTALLTPVPGSNPAATINWSVSGAGCTGLACGSVVPSGSGATATYMAPAAVPSPNQVTVTATPVADSSKAASMPVVVTLPVTLVLSPLAADVVLGASANFTATVTGSSDASVTWDVNGVIGGNATVGTITPTAGNSTAANYTAPQSMPATNPLSVRARSNAAPAVTATAMVTLSPSVQISLTPAASSLIAGQRQTFTAQVSNSTNTSVTWQVDGTAGGNSVLGQVCVVNSNPCQTVTSAAAGNVDYVGPAAVPSPNPVTLTVVSQADTTQSASSTITILPHVVVTVAPPSATLAPASSQLFAASVAGSANQQVTWAVVGAACNGANASCGTVDATGLYRAPVSAPSPNTFSVVATSSADTSRSGSASLTIAALPIISSLLPSSALAGAAGGFNLQVQGGNFAASTPGPGSTILVGGSARATTCTTTSACSTTLVTSDLQAAANIGVAVQNPDGTLSNSAAFVVVTASGTPNNIPVTTGAPAATGKDIVVVDLSTNGSTAPPQNVSLNVLAVGAFQPASAACSLAGGPVTLVRPASGMATAYLCAFSVSGLDPSLLYTLSGPTPADIVIVGTEPLGLGIIQLTLQVPATAQTGARSLLIQNANQDLTAASGAIDVR